MVTGIGCPTECQFRQVTCANHQTIVLVSHIHENKRANACLGILVGYVVRFYIMIDVMQVLGYYVAYRYLVDGNAQFIHQIDGIAIGTIRSAKAGHSYTQYAVTGITKHVGRLHRYNQRQRTVQSAAYPHHERLRMCMLPTTCQSRCLDGQHIHTISILFIFNRQKRCRIERAVNGFGKAFGVLDRSNIDLAEMSLAVFGEVRISLSVGTQALHINLADSERRLALEAFAFGNQFAVLGDVCRTREHSRLLRTMYIHNRNARAGFAALTSADGKRAYLPRSWNWRG